MPYKRTYRRKRRRKKSAWSRKRRTAYQPRAAIADSQLVKLRYGDLISIDAGAGTTATHVFRANDLYDPNSSGVGHQPLGFDEWMGFYNHFTVIGSRITAVFMPEGTTVGTNSHIISITVEDDTTASTTITDMMEKTGSVWKYSGPADAGTGGSRTLRKSFSTKKFFNVTNVKDNNDLKGSVSAGPVDQAHYHLTYAAADGSSNAGAITVAVTIEYIALLSERKNLVQS